VTLHTGSVSALRIYQDGKETTVKPEDGQITVTLAQGDCALIVW
jgi:hypothetical protein